VGEIGLILPLRELKEIRKSGITEEMKTAGIKRKSELACPRRRRAAHQHGSIEEKTFF